MDIIIRRGKTESSFYIEHWALNDFYVIISSSSTNKMALGTSCPVLIKNLTSPEVIAFA